MHCFNIDYFPKEEYSPDPNDSTMAIPCKCQGHKLLGNSSKVSLSGTSCLIKDRQFRLPCEGDQVFPWHSLILEKNTELVPKYHVALPSSCATEHQNSTLK